MKPAIASRTIWIFAILATAFMARQLQRHLPAELAQVVADLLSDQLMDLLVPVLATAGIVVKMGDRAVVEQLLAQKPRVVDAKAEPK